MKRVLASDRWVLWPSRLESSGAVVKVKTQESTYRFVFAKGGIKVSGGKVGIKAIPAKIHGMQFLSCTLYMNRIKTGGHLEFNQHRTSMVKTITIECHERLLRRALGKWPDEVGGPSPSNPLQI